MALKTFRKGSSSDNYVVLKIQSLGQIYHTFWNFLVQKLVQTVGQPILTIMYCSLDLFSVYYLFCFMFAWVFSSMLYMFSKSLDVCTLYRYLYFFHISYIAKEDILMVREWEVFSNNVLLMYVCMLCETLCSASAGEEPHWALLINYFIWHSRMVT